MPFSDPYRLFPALNPQMESNVLRTMFSPEQVQFITSLRGILSIGELARQMQRPVEEVKAEIQSFFMYGAVQMYLRVDTQPPSFRMLKWAELPNELRAQMLKAQTFMKTRVERASQQEQPSPWRQSPSSGAFHDTNPEAFAETHFPSASNPQLPQAPYSPSQEGLPAASGDLPSGRASYPLKHYGQQPISNSSANLPQAGQTPPNQSGYTFPPRHPEPPEGSLQGMLSNLRKRKRQKRATSHTPIVPITPYDSDMSSGAARDVSGDHAHLIGMDIGLSGQMYRQQSSPELPAADAEIPPSGYQGMLRASQNAHSSAPPQRNLREIQPTPSSLPTYASQEQNPWKTFVDPGGSKSSLGALAPAHPSREIFDFDAPDDEFTEENTDESAEAGHFSSTSTQETPAFHLERSENTQENDFRRMQASPKHSDQYKTYFSPPPSHVSEGEMPAALIPKGDSRALPKTGDYPASHPGRPSSPSLPAARGAAAEQNPTAPSFPAHRSGSSGLLPKHPGTPSGAFDYSKTLFTPKKK